MVLELGLCLVRVQHVNQYTIVIKVCTFSPILKFGVCQGQFEYGVDPYCDCVRMYVPLFFRLLHFPSYTCRKSPKKMNYLLCLFFSLFDSNYFSYSIIRAKQSPFFQHHLFDLMQKRAILQILNIILSCAFVEKSRISHFHL